MRELLRLLQFEEYEKGTLPFVLTREKLETLWQNNNPEGLPRSDFATFLESELKGGELNS